MRRINSYDELKATVEKYKPLLDLRKKDGIIYEHNHVGKYDVSVYQLNLCAVIQG